MKKALILIPTFLLALAMVYNVYAQDVVVHIPLISGISDHVHATAVAPYQDAPACATHDDTAYHGLWDEVNGCHADHTHYIDPHSPAVVAIFGDYTEYTGQAVSYPWQTWAGATVGYPQPPADPAYELDHKGHGYKFDFKDLASYGTCPIANPAIRAVPNAWLVQRHSLGDARDARVRIHSFWGMARFCIPGTNEVAYLYSGGWADFGQRITPYQGALLPYADTPLPKYQTNRSPYLAHGCINGPDCRGDSEFTWSAINQFVTGHRLFGFVFRGNDAHDIIDLTGGLSGNPTFRYLCANGDGTYNPVGCKYNNTQSHTFQLTGTIPESFDLLDGADDDRVTYEGYTDRWGVIVNNCTAIGLDCVPLNIVNMPVGNYHVNLPQYSEEDFTPVRGDHVIPDYDLYFDGQPSGWVGPDN